MGLQKLLTVIGFSLVMAGCITPDNSTVEGTGTPDVVQCSTLPGVEDGAKYQPQDAITLGLDGRKHPDIFYIGWAELDQRIDLRRPARGYDQKGVEDKLFVSRRQTDGSFRTWQLWPALDNDCKDAEQVRIQSFDIAPDGKSLFVSMSREEEGNPKRKLGIYKLDTTTQILEKISKDNTVDFMHPTYIGNDPETGNEQLFVAKTVTDEDIPVNYAARSVLQDEYDRDATPLIHRMDVETGDVTVIGFNNSHQTEPVAMKDPSGNPIIVFTQWEHQSSTNRFALWKMQVDGSDSFTFYGQESAIDERADNLFSAREIQSGPNAGYVLMTQASRTTSNHFTGEGDIVMTKRNHFDLRSERVALQSLQVENSSDTNISRSPEHYNDESYVFSQRETADNAYALYIADYPRLEDGGAEPESIQVMMHNDYHFMQARSFYPPESDKVAPTDGDLGQSRVSFTNENLKGNSGFLVQDLRQSDNGIQHQLDGLEASDLSMQFFIPSHHFSNSNTVALKSGSGSGEMSIPVGGLIKPEVDGSMGVILKDGLYVWKVNKRFEHTDDTGAKNDIWIPVRAERQEINFVPNRVNACNQCHQERDQANITKYENYHSIAERKMQGDLSELMNTYNDISDYKAYDSVPDFHGDIVALLNKPGLVSGKSCADCHTAKDKLNLSNNTGVSQINATYRNLVVGAHKLEGTETTVPYLSQSINPMGMDNSYSYAPFMWSLLLNSDLSVPSNKDYPDNSSRNLDREGDYGAIYSSAVEGAISDINGQYDHSSHWAAADIQSFITYSTTQAPVGLSNRIAESFTKDSLTSASPAAQKAYQALVRNCFDCHNNHAEGISAEGYGRPLEKRYSDSVWLRDTETRFVIKSHLANKQDQQYSIYPWQSNLTTSMSRTLASAKHRIDFDNPEQSELLRFAKGEESNANVSDVHTARPMPADDLQALEDWVAGEVGVNTAPQIQAPTEPIVIKEYEDPSYLKESIVWSDPDNGDLSQVFIKGSGVSSHAFNDSMLALEYDSLTSAKLKTYAILGDRGSQEFTFTVTDGQQSGQTQTIPVTVETDYLVPKPQSTMPNGYAFYTDRLTGDLRKLNTDGSDEIVGNIGAYSSDWTTVYRRADKGWLYFLNQNEQKIYVVDETDASVQFTMSIKHLPKETTNHKQTIYLLWWRPAEGNPGDTHYRPGELQALLESKLSKTKNGDFYVNLGDGEPPISGDEIEVQPEWRTKLADGGNTVSVYVWKRATFMNKWVNQGTDRVNVLNLETGKAKSLNDFSFEEKIIDGVTYPAAEYLNVRAVVVAEDGSFYAVNKDLNVDAEVFMFDPLEGVQQPITDVPQWIQHYMNNPIAYGTPFLVIDNQGP